MTTVGSLGLDVSINGGFEILSDSFGDNLALALLTPAGGTGNTGLYTIDLLTGNADLFADLGPRDFASFAAETNNGPAPVPLPASALMLLAGLGGLQLMRRRKTKA